MCCTAGLLFDPELLYLASIAATLLFLRYGTGLVREQNFFNWFNKYVSHLFSYFRLPSCSDKEETPVVNWLVGYGAGFLFTGNAKPTLCPVLL